MDKNKEKQLSERICYHLSIEQGREDSYAIMSNVAGNVLGSETFRLSQNRLDLAQFLEILRFFNNQTGWDIRFDAESKELRYPGDEGYENLESLA